MYPAAVVIWTLVPAVNVDKVYPPLSPIKSCPFAGVSVNPVPPYITARGFVRVKVLLLRFVIEPKDEVMVFEDKVAVTVKLPARVSVVFLRGVYPRAVVISTDAREKVAVASENPALSKIKVLKAGCGVEKEILVIKFGKTLGLAVVETFVTLPLESTVTTGI